MVLQITDKVKVRKRNSMKTLLTGMIFCTLFLLSCSGGGGNNETELRDEVCSQFIKYKRCTKKQLTGDNSRDCGQEYGSQMRELRAKYGNATISTGFINYQDVRDSLDNCVSSMKPEDQWKECFLDFQNSVLEGLQCNKARR